MASVPSHASGGGARWRRWSWTHRWASLICTVFLLLLCLTGLPLIFTDEIEAWQDPPPVSTSAPDSPRTSLDTVLSNARARLPGWQTDFVVIDDEAPVISVFLKPQPDAPITSRRQLRFDAHSGLLLDTKPSVSESHLGFMLWVRKLHTELFAGLPGALFLGAMGLLFVVAIVSGLVLYGPFMRKLDFGTVRSDRGRRTHWLDLHNLVGIVTLAWVLVVGLTGVLNELSTPLFGLWLRTDVRALLLPYAHEPPVRAAESGSVQAAVDTVQKALPGNVITSVVFPENPLGSPHHFVLWTKGRSSVTSRLFSPVLVDARNGALTAVLHMPWYLTLLEVSRPLHFGDYGGFVLKLVWAMLDLACIGVLLSGLYLWLARGTRTQSVRRQPAAHRPGFASSELARSTWAIPTVLAGSAVLGLGLALLSDTPVLKWLGDAALALPLLVMFWRLMGRRTL